MADPTQSNNQAQLIRRVGAGFEAVTGDGQEVSLVPGVRVTVGRSTMLDMGRGADMVSLYDAYHSGALPESLMQAIGPRPMTLPAAAAGFGGPQPPTPGGGPPPAPPAPPPGIGPNTTAPPAQTNMPATAVAPIGPVNGQQPIRMPGM